MTNGLFPASKDPGSGLSYPQALPDSPVRLIFGAALAVSVFIITMPLISQLILGIAYAMRGRPGDFGDFYSQAMAYEFPEGVVASHLSLGFLIVVSLAAARWMHGRGSIWAWSVQPGMRWRYLLICLGLAAITLNGVLWFSFLFVGEPVFQAAEPGWIYFAMILIFTSPLQAVAEEVFFRGYLLQAFGSAASRAWVGIVVSAVIFALFHGVQNPALFANRLAFGLLAGWLVWKTGGLEAAIAAHVVNNLFAFGYGFFTGGIAATKATSAIGWDRAAFDVLGFALFAALAWWVGRKLNVATRSP